MNKVVKKVWDESKEGYLFVLSNGDSVFVTEENYDRKMKHISTEGKTYEAVVDEHADNPNEPVEYIGFK